MVGKMTLLNEQSSLTETSKGTDCEQHPTLKQIIPSQTCFSCDVCCRFLDQQSHLAPIFTKEEFDKAIQAGLSADLFQNSRDGSSRQIRLKPYRDFFICPAFDPDTQQCTIYEHRPLDCQIYPLAIMRDVDGQKVVLGIDPICPFAEAEIQTQFFQHYADHISSFLESEITVNRIAQNRDLIGCFQENVVVVRQLTRLTEKVVAKIAPPTDPC